MTINKSMLARPVTEDGLVGYDSFGQFAVLTPYFDGTSMHHIRDVRGMTCAICEHGWAETGPSMADQRHWPLIDAPVHESCFIRYLGLNERAEFFEALCAAKVRFRGLKILPNGYWSESDPWSKKPWYQAELLDHPASFILGWRKRVAQIELRAEGGTEFAWLGAAWEAFSGEDVTKEFTPKSVTLHAWNDDKVREYVKRLVGVAAFGVTK